MVAKITIDSPSIMLEKKEKTLPCCLQECCSEIIFTRESLSLIIGNVEVVYNCAISPR
jgi:hypothetical protein